MIAGELSFPLETEYQSALARLRRGSRPALWGLLLIGSLIAFVLVEQSGSTTPLNLAVLVGVLLFHESGHYLGMRVFGWRDVKMFFIPFLGAAVSGRRGGAESWKEGVVLLLGPLPGIALGLAIAAAIRTGGSPSLRTAAAMLIGVNGFNLLPLAVLDGGKLLQLTLFQRHRWAEVGFLIVAALGLGGAAAWLDAQVLTYVAIAALVSLPLRYRLLKAAQKLREQDLEVPVDARELDGEVGRAVYVAARETLSDLQRKREANVVHAMESLVDLVSRTVPGPGQTAALLALWLAGVGAGAGGLWLMKHPRLVWQEVADPDGYFSVWMPGRPAVSEDPIPTLLGGAQSRRFTVEMGDYAFMVQSLKVPEGAVDDLEQWHAAMVQRMQKELEATPVSDQRTVFIDQDAFDARLRHHAKHQLRVVGFSHAGKRFVLMSTAPADDPSRDQFFDSFALLK